MTKLFAPVVFITFTVGMVLLTGKYLESKQKKRFVQNKENGSDDQSQKSHELRQEFDIQLMREILRDTTS